MGAFRALGLPLFFAIQTVFIGVFLLHSPFMMDSPAVSKTKPWADGPMRLVETPHFRTKKVDLFTTGANHMALLHNSILRGYNSIWQQAPHIKDAEKADFIGYALTWHKFVVSHHDDEEEVLFTKVEELLDDHNVWKDTHEEHEAFLAGLAAYHEYLTSVSSTPKSFSAERLREIMSSFQKPFESHFHSEIATIVSLGWHPNAPVAGTPRGDEASEMFKAWGKKTVAKGGVTDVVPFFLHNLDGTAEGGVWASWPPMPAPIRWGLVNIVGMWYAGQWKFGSCDGLGNPRELWALRSAQSEL